MLSAGFDLGPVGAVLGHKSAQTTKRYAHHAVERLADALPATKTRQSGKKVPPAIREKTA